MSSIQDWTITAASNATSDAALTWAEGMAASAVNNSARQMMGRVAEYLGDQASTVTVGGTANAITVTANEGIIAYTEGFRIVFKAGAKNTAATTLNVNSIGAKSVRQYANSASTDVALSGGEFISGRLYEVVYLAGLNSAAGGWLLTNASRPLISGGNTNGSAMNTATSGLGEMDIRGDSSGATMVSFGRPSFAAYFGLDTDNLLKVGGATMGANAYRILHEGLASGTFTGSYSFTGSTQVFQAFSATGATAGSRFLAGQLSISNTGTTLSLPGVFYNANGIVGTISTTGSATAYNTSSDRRLKENPRPFDAGPVLDKLKVYSFDWKTGGSGYGVFAQEAVKVFPDAVTKGKGKRPWQVDYSKYVPLLLQEIKNLRARLDALEAK